MKKGITSKVVWLSLALCIIASMLAFACGEAEPEAPTPTPVTPTPTPEKPAAEKPAAEEPAAVTPTPEKPAPTAPGGPQYGGTLRMLAMGQVGHDNMGAPSIVPPPWNPLPCSPAVEQLLHWDENGLIIPYLAKDWEWSDDNLSLTLFLEEGVKFHDGTDFNADAVEFNLQLMKDSHRPECKTLESMEVIDDYTIRLNLQSFDNQFLIDLGAVAGAIVSPTAWQLYGGEYCVDHPVGTGAFKFVSYEKDVLTRFERFDDYWQEGKPYLDAIEYIHMADSMTAKAAFMAGEGNMVARISPQDAAELAATGKYVINCTTDAISGIGGDGSHADSPFSNLKVRQAIAHALDKQTICDAIGYGYLIPADQAAYPGLWSYNPDVVGYEYDPEKARALLAEAGYPDGLQTKIVYQTGSDMTEQFMLIVQQMLGDVGIDVTLEPAASSRFQLIYNEGWNNHLIPMGPMNPIGYSPFNALIKHHCSFGPFNVSVYHNDDFEEKISAALIEPDQDKMIQLVHEAQKLMFDTHCMYAPIYVSPNLLAKYPELHDERMYDPWGSDWQPWNAWLEQD